jgi:hypothetical protein
VLLFNKLSQNVQAPMTQKLKAKQQLLPRRQQLQQQQLKTEEHQSIHMCVDPQIPQQ